MQHQVDFICLVASIILAAFRVSGFKSQFFQAIAHLWVGILLGAWAALPRNDSQSRPQRYLIMAVFLSIVEVIVFVIQHANSH